VLTCTSHDPESVRCVHISSRHTGEAAHTRSGAVLGQLLRGALGVQRLRSGRSPRPTPANPAGQPRGWVGPHARPQAGAQATAPPRR